MSPKLEPVTNLLGRDVSARTPAVADVVGASPMPAHDEDVWRLAAPHLRVRSNDAHTLYSYELARALVDLVPGADADVVLPAVLLHDTGWSRVPEEEVLEAIAPGGDRPDLVRRHEVEGAAIAREVLEQLGRSPEVVDRVVAIVDGHDSRAHATSVDDAVVKDADKLWRLTPHGVDTVMDWFGLTREQAHLLIGSRVHTHLLTDAGRTVARGLATVARTDTSAQLGALG
ncbi:HD domain-containing protein [Quadrisphaera sp. KR29]|uniref:HD domain-containing protein n=1 Tax=Quadrisphaera sp. KR29 TaxID=3461391 RepID=UPI0040448104